MAILSEDYEPQLDTVKLGEVFRLTIKNPYNIEYEKRIYDIELIRDKGYSIDELCKLIQGLIKAQVTHDGCAIYIQKQYMLRKHTHLNTNIIVHYSESVWYQMPTGKIMYIKYNPHEITTTPKYPEVHKRMIQGNYYGSIKHICRNNP